MVMTDRLLVLENGRVVQDGRPLEVARRPATQYVARLVGLNMYRGRLGPHGHVRLDGEGGTLVTAATTVGERPVLVALRPAAIALHPERPGAGSPRNVWPGVITGLELLADRVRLQVDGVPPAMVDVTPEAVAELALDEGSAVWLSAKATELEVYDAELEDDTASSADG
jgi:molybdate transport system ATP-binding protein